MATARRLSTAERFGLDITRLPSCNSAEVLIFDHHHGSSLPLADLV